MQFSKHARNRKEFPLTSEIVYEDQSYLDINDDDEDEPLPPPAGSPQRDAIVVGSSSSGTASSGTTGFNTAQAGLQGVQPLPPNSDHLRPSYELPQPNVPLATQYVKPDWFPLFPRNA